MIRPYHLLLGTIGFAAIILYGSLVPFEYKPRPFVEMVDQFISICQQPLRIGSRSDFLANILLFVPLAFLLLGALQQSFPGYRYLFHLPVILFCVSYGALIEFVQLVFPPRTTALNDILAQIIGSTAGALLWSLVGNQAVNYYNTHTLSLQLGNRLAPLLYPYLLIVVILNAAPFDFTISPVEVVHKYREGRIEWMPFRSLQYADQNLMIKWLWHMIVFFPVGVLLGNGKSWTGWSVAGLSLLFASCIEFMQVAVLTRNVDTSDIFTGSLAILSGWGIIRWYQQQQSRLVLLVAFTLWFTAAILINWSPFQFSPDGITAKWSSMSFIPFLDYQTKNYLSAFDDIAHKCIFFMLLGILLSALSHARLRTSLALIISGIVSAIIEGGQFFVPGRYPSVSDILLGAGAGAAGCLLANSSTTRHRNHP